jgi:hypothetical protein
MAKLPEQKRLLKEEFKEAPNWIDKLLTPLNRFIETVYNILNRNVDFRNNIRCDIVEYQFKTTPSGTFNLPIILKHNLRSRPDGVLLIEIRQVDGNYSPVNGALSVQWRGGAQEIFIESIGVNSLNNSTTYMLKFLVI